MYSSRHSPTSDLSIKCFACLYVCLQVGLLTEFAVPYSSRPVEVVEVSTSASSSVEESKADNEGKAIVVEGTDIDGMNGDDWSYVCRHEQIIFARVTPDQKLQVQSFS